MKIQQELFTSHRMLNVIWKSQLMQEEWYPQSEEMADWNPK